MRMASKPEGSNRTRPTFDQQPVSPPPKRGGYQRQGLGEAVLKSFVRSIASSIGRIIARALMGRIR
jgi:hypothetical protein